MTRRRTRAERSIAEARRHLWRWSSILGDAEAIASGSPAKVARRAIRKQAWRGVGRALGRLLAGR